MFSKRGQRFKMVEKTSILKRKPASTTRKGLSYIYLILSLKKVSGLGIGLAKGPILSKMNKEAFEGEVIAPFLV
jgi:hypothetical protein